MAKINGGKNGGEIQTSNINMEIKLKVAHCMAGSATKELCKLRFELCIRVKKRLG